MSCANQGKQQLLQHAKGENHRKYSNNKRGQGILALVCGPKNKEKNGDGTENMKTASDASASQQTLSYSVPREPSLKAEIIWLLYMCHNHPIYRSCDGLPGVFQAMFPDSQIAANLSIFRTRASYMISDGLGPEFLRQLLDDVMKSDMFTMHYDEATNKEGKKQLDLHVRYWSAVTDDVRVTFYKAIDLPQVLLCMMKLLQHWIKMVCL